MIRALLAITGFILRLLPEPKSVYVSAISAGLIFCITGLPRLMEDSSRDL